MKTAQVKKTFVLGVLFVLPLVAYLFFASGVNNFGRLPIMTSAVEELPENEAAVVLANKISIVGYLGSDLSQRQVNMFNLNQKIYKRFSEFKDFQMLMVLPKGTEDQLAKVMQELSAIGEVEAWRFIFLTPEQIQTHFESLQVPERLDATFGTDQVYIIDKALQLRGRKANEQDKALYGYNATEVSLLTKTMIDDVKILLAEYRMALKKNNQYKDL
ncbi:MAG: hypothetical protein P8N20_06815 [Flavobacteriaceae bacterium]|nr:hypothetical protein [Flavobacteriaceae bacterium]MDG2414434.1 hypothetical protein [Flavobacteriaceae bacterium]